jgi:hypothetical protein
LLAEVPAIKEPVIVLEPQFKEPMVAELLVVSLRQRKDHAIDREEWDIDALLLLNMRARELEPLVGTLISIKIELLQ